MKKLAAIILAGVLTAGAFTTVNAAEFSDGTDTEREEYFDDNYDYSWSAGEDATNDTEETKSVSANDSIVEGFEKPLVFYPNTYYKFNVIGAGTQNMNPVNGDVRWTPLYWSLSIKPQESNINRKWEIGSAKGIYTKVERAYNMYVFFQREEYIENAWVKMTLSSQ